MIKIKKNKDFIGTLRNILENEEYQGIIQLLKEKNGFKILDQEQFKSVILVKHFTHNNYSSFRRQLNLYGFQSRKSNKNEILYTNESFNFETDKKLKKQRKSEICSENIELEQKRQLNQLLQLQQNQKQMIEQIKTIITTQEETKQKMKCQLSNYVKQRFKSDERDKFLFLALSLYTNIKDQKFSKHFKLIRIIY
ncbi:unnamed protein product [Paramecium primaurelia]|uniref:HSF-type DNA-binding domain-containing protein n=1 Tax=Paramecium primaurelia TaxID=5886 RepID=A0A8S1MQ84_PARPR|nr:unnamed protein product [Paramecium primaurelia]